MKEFFAKNEKLLTLISLILVIVGGINWLLIGLLDINLVSGILGHILARLIYIIVGLGACYLIYINWIKTAVVK